MYRVAIVLVPLITRRSRPFAVSTIAGLALALIACSSATARGSASSGAITVRGQVVSGALNTPAPGSLANLRRTIMHALRGGPGAAPADLSGPLSIADPLGVTARRKPSQPWYRLPSATFFVSTALPVVRFEGMIFSVQANGQAHRCTGTIVNSPTGSVVWTAGHCVFDRQFGGAFPTIVFVPEAGIGPNVVQPSAPVGWWQGVRWATTKDWYLHGSARSIKRDLGAVVVARTPTGESVQQAVGGAQRLSFGVPTRGRTAVFGYPAAGQFNGNDRLVGCGPRPTGIVSTGGSGPDPLGIACAMTPGSSGGPWLQHMRGGIGTIVAVTSERADREPLLFGPVIGSVGKRLFQQVASVSPPALAQPPGP
jgi:hypothetical protein